MGAFMARGRKSTDNADSSDTVESVDSEGSAQVISGIDAALAVDGTSLEGGGGQGSGAPPAGPHAGGHAVNIEDEMRSSYVDYAMSVIVGRALPDVRDGLKPVHRRVLFTMHELKNNWNGAYKKSARIVGDCIGKYHPHGDTAVYDTLVRMAQDFSLRYLLVDGQGNFGSVDGDPAAAMRYTEVRLTRLAHELMADLDKDTVDFIPNYDGHDHEPSVFPSKIPNLLVNGSEGIAVGMATKVPPHNLTEVVDALLAIIDEPGIELSRLCQIITGPDFPTGGIIYGREGIKQAYETGRGKIRIRAKTHTETMDKSGRESIVVDELSYLFNKAQLIAHIAELVRDKKIEGISDLRDESDREGMRMVIELKRDAISQVVLNQLFTMTALQSTFGIINLAIVNGRPEVLTLDEMLGHFLHHRRDVVTRRCLYELRIAEARAHVLEGLLIALDHLDQVIELIRASATPDAARSGLMASFALSEIQAQAILDMRLQRLTGLERDKIRTEHAELMVEIGRLRAILADEKLLMTEIRKELVQVRADFGDARRTQIVDDTGALDIEDLIADEDVVVTISHTGYIKRSLLSTYRAQRRGGRGKQGTGLKDEDWVNDLFVASTHAHVLVFTSKGRVFQLKVHEIPAADRSARGKPIVNLVPVAKDERVRAVLPVREFVEGRYLFMATRNGTVKKTDLMEYSKIRSTGIIAIVLDEGDDLIDAKVIESYEEILLATRDGMSCRFPSEQVRGMGRATRGVRGIALEDADHVVSMAIVPSEDAVLGAGVERPTILTCCENGYGKRTPSSDYRLQNRGGKGIITIKTTDRNGPVISVRAVAPDDECMIITDRGQLIRIRVKEISVIGRNTQGVRLINMGDGEKVVTLERIAEREDEDVMAPPAEA